MSKIPTPLNDDIVLIEAATKEVSDGGILLPQQYLDRDLREGSVVAVGPGSMYPDYTRSRMDVRVGDKVLFSRLAGVEIRYERGSYLVLSQKSVLAIVEEGPDEID